MIIRGEQNTTLKRIPFLAKFEVNEDEDKKISFLEGKIFECFNSSVLSADEDNRFSEGAYCYKPKNMDEKFDYEDDDQFYLRLDGENSSIEKTNNPQDGDILIWKDNTQFLSENVFIQQSEKQLAFARNLIEIKEDGSRRYKINGGAVCIFNEGIVEHIDSFEYTEEKGKEKFHYIQIDIEITEESGPDTVRGADRKYIKDFEVRGIKVVSRESDEKITDLDKVNSQAYIGEKCAQKEGEYSNPLLSFEENRKRGTYWIDLPAEGNLHLNVEVFDVAPTLLFASPFDATFDESEIDEFPDGEFPLGTIIGVSIGDFGYQVHEFLFDDSRMSDRINPSVKGQEFLKSEIMSVGKSNNKCKDFPDSIPINPNMFDQVELEGESLKHLGQGEYEIREFDVSDDPISISYQLQEEEDGSFFFVFDDVGEVDQCSYYEENGENLVTDVETRIYSKTSFIYIDDLKEERVYGSF
tara:strand:- start:12051 stop:13454 length:1404 start_codon:yes stop_codon:yes gene_type:complete